MRLRDFRVRTLAAFFAPFSLVACTSLTGDFTTHPVDAGTVEDSSVEASTDGAPREAQAMDSSSPMDSPSTSDTGTDTGIVGMDGATHLDATSDAPTCSMTLCGTSCVDTSTDPTNCGTCGKTCNWWMACNNGTCGCPGGYTSCNQSCVDLTSDANNCGGCDDTCGGVQPQCCESSCSDGDSDVNNCGGCDNACGGVSPQCCSGSCADTDSDPNNCGGCGNACPSTCTGGSCD